MGGLTGGGSKATLRVGGVSLIERAIHRMRSLGIEDVIVVVGSGSTSVERSVRRAARLGARTMLADAWDEGNGASLAAAEPELVDDPSFVVMAADHVFSDGALDALATASGPCVLVDEQPDPSVWSEGTRVRIDDGNAVEFSKHLAEPAVDCGVFVLTPAIFEAQRQAAAEGDASLAAAVSRFANEHPLAAVPIPQDAWWHDIDVPRDVTAVRRSLRRSLRKPTDGPVSRFLNRPISTRITMAIAGLRPSPHAISVVAFLMSLVAAFLLADGYGVAGGALVQACSVVDGVDGEIARLQHRATPWGALLDGILDRLGDAVIVGGLAIWAIDSGLDAPWAVGLAVAATTGSMLSMATKDRIRALGLPEVREDRLNWLAGGRDARLLLVAVAAVAGLPVVALVLIVVTTGITSIARLALVARS
jgi:1L-myo-inositol 1-phosphate cytidylyltransferase / CDP-L-myo-inositol myo-inositolphosphotransferase